MTPNRIVGLLVVAAVGFLAGVAVGRHPLIGISLPSVPSTDLADPEIQALIRLQTKLAASLAPLDSLALDTLLAADMRAINAADQRLEKSTAIDMLRNVQAALLHVVDDSIQVRRYGLVALMTLRETVTIRAAAGESSGRLRMTEVWLKRDGRWQVVGSQATALP